MPGLSLIRGGILLCGRYEDRCDVNSSVARFPAGKANSYVSTLYTKKMTVLLPTGIEYVDESSFMGK